VSSRKFAWESLARQRAAQRTLNAKYAPKPPKRRRGSHKPDRNAPRESTRLRCPKCSELRVTKIPWGGIWRYRCDSCDEFVQDPIPVTGKTFTVLT
jgi:hypothetical protein